MSRQADSATKVSQPHGGRALRRGARLWGHGKTLLGCEVGLSVLDITCSLRRKIDRPSKVEEDLCTKAQYGDDGWLKQSIAGFCCDRSLFGYR